MLWLQSTREPADLTPIENPPKDADYHELLEQVRRFGIVEPLLITRDDLIFDGCRRWMAAQELGIDQVDVLVYQEACSTEDALKMRAVLHCSRRKPRIEEIQLVLGLEPASKPVSTPLPGEMERLINDMFCAQGLGPRVMLEIVKQVPIVVLRSEDDENQELEELLERFPWKSE